MGTDLNAPLGQGRRKRAARRLNPRRIVAHALLATCFFAVLGLSGWSAFAPDRLIRTPATVEDATAVAVPGTEGPSERSGDAKHGTVRVSGALSGARVEEIVTGDGATVTKYTPRPRGSDGPALISAGPTRGQDPRMAALPNEDLLEATPEGRLPIVGPEGLRPMDQYARPWSGTRGTRIALVVGGLGLSQTGTLRAIQALPPDVTLAFAAAGNSLQRWMQEARRDGHEILLQIPMEPFDYPSSDPGPQALLVSQSQRKNLAELHRSMGRITNYTGIMNYLGGRFLSDADALGPVMRDLGKRGLLFLDDGTSAQSLSGTLAGAFDVPHGFADMVVDGELSRGAILRRLDELERVARRNGTAVGVASAFEESVAAIAEWMEEAGGRGIEFVGVSAVVKDPQQN
ncbi:MAG: divergent polysaccharide deacetylase family protein [Ensifer alkalisoli]|nr:divergent polysaccharide deacetylase family protein [Sinorhizobium alkalisoli]